MFGVDILTKYFFYRHIKLFAFKDYNINIYKLFLQQGHYLHNLCEKKVHVYFFYLGQRVIVTV